MCCVEHLSFYLLASSCCAMHRPQIRPVVICRSVAHACVFQERIQIIQTRMHVRHAYMSLS